MLPGTDGVELMKRVPGLTALPVIFISGYGGDETVARALEAGAVDYIVKPFSATELVARVAAALRRRAEPEPFVMGALAIDYERRRVTVAGREVELTATEYELLRVLSVKPGRGVELRGAAGRGVGRGQGRPGAGARHREEAPPQARSRRARVGLDPQRARGRLPHAQAGRAVSALRGAGRFMSGVPSGAYSAGTAASRAPNLAPRPPLPDNPAGVPE